MSNDTDLIGAATHAPMFGTFHRPTWGLTAAIPEGVSLAWGARAIYAMRSVSVPVAGRTKLKSTTIEPVIDLLWDRMGWSSLAGDPEDHEARARYFSQLTSEASRAQNEAERAMSVWINDVGIPALRKACIKQHVVPSSEVRIEYESNGYKIVANPNGSCGYLYIAAWKVPQ